MEWLLGHGLSWAKINSDVGLAKLFTSHHFELLPICLGPCLDPILGCHSSTHSATMLQSNQICKVIHPNRHATTAVESTLFGLYCRIYTLSSFQAITSPSEFPNLAPAMYANNDSCVVIAPRHLCIVESHILRKAVRLRKMEIAHT